MPKKYRYQLKSGTAAFWVLFSCCHFSWVTCVLGHFLHTFPRIWLQLCIKWLKAPTSLCWFTKLLLIFKGILFLWSAHLKSYVGCHVRITAVYSIASVIIDNSWSFLNPKMNIYESIVVPNIIPVWLKSYESLPKSSLDSSWRNHCAWNYHRFY